MYDSTTNPPSRIPYSCTPYSRIMLYSGIPYSRIMLYSGTPFSRIMLSMLSCFDIACDRDLSAPAVSDRCAVPAQWTAAYRDAVDQIWELRERNSIPRTRVLLAQLKLTKTLVDLHSRYETFRLQGHVLHRGDRFKTYGFPFSRFKDIFVTPRKRFRIPYCEYCEEHKVWFDFKQDRRNFVDHKFIHTPRRPLDEACDHDRTAEWLEAHKDCISIF